jgi:hypothetical protein
MFAWSRKKAPYVVKVYAGSGWGKEREARSKMQRGSTKMLEKGYRLKTATVANSKGTITGWQRFEVVVTYELLQ